jgi:hypothetical protein
VQNHLGLFASNVAFGGGRRDINTYLPFGQVNDSPGVGDCGKYWLWARRE